MKNKNSNKMVKLITSIVIALCMIIGVAVTYKETGEIDKNQVGQAVNTITNAIETYNLTDEEVKELPTTEIKEVTEQDEKEAGEEQATTENEGFEEQGNIAYNGDNEFPKVELGNYVGLTYYSQFDSRWANYLYTSTGNTTQTMKSSGCGPTSAAMIITATKGTITPEKVADLFVKYGYRSADNGTYYSAFRFVADVFNIEYTETYNFDEAVNLLKNNHYVVVSCGNGLFTTGGHFIVLTEIENDTISIYDPYLYAGKFETSTRRGKVAVSGNTTYCSVDNFRKYANYKKFFAYKHSEQVQVNNAKEVTTNTYTRFVKANGGLKIRTGAGMNYSQIGLLQTGSQVTVYETNSNWSRIGNNQWICSDYLYLTPQTIIQTTSRDIETLNIVKNTTGQVKRIKASTLYSNSNLTGIKYNYKANTSITILENVSSNVDKIKVNVTGRIAYINTANYISTSNSKNSNTVKVNSVKNTIGQKRKIKASIIYSKSNLTGTRYTYKNNTTVTILQNVNSNVDKIKVNVTGRIAYIKVDSYK